MRIGKQAQNFTAISTSDAERIFVRGQDLCAELIGKTDFTAYFWLLVTGVMPDERQLFFANAVLVALAEHGLVPSVVTARATFAAAPEAFHGAVAAGLLGCGSVILGSAEVCGRFLSDLVARATADNLPFEQVAVDGVTALRHDRKPVAGFGHPLHAAGDPRANLLLDLAREKGVTGPHLRMLTAVREAIPQVLGRSLPVNINGAIPSILLDLGFPLASLKGIGLLARTAGLIGHLQEESQRPIGFILAESGAAGVAYDGPAMPA